MKKINFSGVWNWVLDAIYVVKNFLGMVFCSIIYCGAFVLGTVFLAILSYGILFPILTALCFNPIMFPLWTAIVPYTMVKMLYAHDNSETRWALNGWAIFWRFFIGWEVYLLPWSMKKHFVNSEPEKFGYKSLIRFYRESDNGVETLEKMPYNFCDRLWKEGNDDDKKNIILARLNSQWRIDTMHLVFMFDHKMKEELLSYAEKNTLPANFISKLLEENLSHCTIDSLSFMLLERQIIKHGLVPELIKIAYRHGNAGVAEHVGRWLSIYGQCRQAKNRTTDEWQMFCINTKEICTEAQVLMNVWQAEMFYRTSHKMSEEAIFYFFSRVPQDATCGFEQYVANSIIANEENCGICSERIRTLVNASFPLKNAVMAKGRSNS